MEDGKQSHCLFFAFISFIFALERKHGLPCPQHGLSTRPWSPVCLLPCLHMQTTSVTSPCQGARFIKKREELKWKDEGPQFLPIATLLNKWVAGWGLAMWAGQAAPFCPLPCSVPPTSVDVLQLVFLWCYTNVAGKSHTVEIINIANLRPSY